MRWAKDIWGTIFPEFKIGKATIQAGGLSDKRSFYLPDADGDLLIDADQDGRLYGRKDGAWAEVVSGGGGSGMSAGKAIALSMIFGG